MAMALVALAVTFYYAVARGQDVNWDQLNYHLAVPALLLRGTFWTSVAPSAIQSYFNPLMMIPQYLVIRSLPPMVATLVLAGAQALAFMVAGWICRVVAGPDRRLAWLGFGLCLASPIALSEAGTTYIDLVTAVPVVLAFGLLMTRDMRKTAWPSCMIAGLLLGAAAGLKLTNLIFLFGVPGFFIVGTETWWQRWHGLVLTALMSVMGFMVVAGWWHWTLWEHFGNPVFPFANGLFRAPDYPSVSTLDDRYMGRSIWDLIRYPLYWAFGGGPDGRSSPSGETDPHDARFLFALAGLSALLISCASNHRLRARIIAAPATGMVIAWFLVLVIWLFTFGIHRYMVGVEILTGAVLLILVRMLPDARWRLYVMLPACLACLVILHVPRWTRLPFGAEWRTLLATPIRLAGRPMVILGDAPTAFLVASMPPKTLLVGGLSSLDETNEADNTLFRQTTAMLADGRTPYILSHATAAPPDRPLLHALKLRIGSDCQAISIAAQDFRLCDLQRD